MRAMAKQHAVGGGQHKHVGRAFFPGQMPAVAPGAGDPARDKTGRRSRRASRNPRCAGRVKTSDRRRCIPRRRRRPDCSGRRPRHQLSSASPWSQQHKRCRTRRSRRCGRAACVRPRGRSACRVRPTRHCSSPPPPSRARGHRGCRAPRWARLPPAWRFGRTVAFLANGPDVHLFGDVAERRNLPDLIEILEARPDAAGRYPVCHGLLRRRLVVSNARGLDTGFGLRVHSHDNLLVDGKDSPCLLMLHRRTCATLGVRSSEISSRARMLNAP